MKNGSKITLNRKFLTCGFYIINFEINQNIIELRYLKTLDNK